MVQYAMMEGTSASIRLLTSRCTIGVRVQSSTPVDVLLWDRYPVWILQNLERITRMGILDPDEA